MRRGTPQPGWLFAAALATFFVTVALAAAGFAWWVFG